MRKLFLFAIILAAAGISFGQVPAGFDLLNYGVRVEPDRRVIAVLATLEMATQKNGAGVEERLINTPLSERNAKFRNDLIADNATLPDDLRRKITAFVASYKRRNANKDDAALVAPFISMAYSLTPAPDLLDPVITFDLPGQLLDVLDFAPLVREYYRRSTISARMDDYLRSYREEADLRLRPSARDMVKELLDYLKTKPRLLSVDNRVVETQKSNSKSSTIKKLERRETERRFFIVPERLAPRGTINFINIRDDYYVVIPPDSDLTGSDVRRAYLQFVLDPIVLAGSRDLTATRDWVKAELDVLRKSNSSISPDVYLALTRSLVAAVDLRQNEFELITISTQQAREKIAMMKTDDEKRAVTAELDRIKQAAADEAAVQLYDDYQRGAVLAFYFADQLRGVEDSGFDIASSLKEMIASFDATKEKARIEATAQARQRGLAAREARRAGGTEVRTTLGENPVTSRLIEIQKTIDRREFAKADSDLKRLLADHPSDPRIYYNIGRVAGQTAVAIDDPDQQAKKLLEAKAAYSNVLSTATGSTDRSLISLTYVALGKIYEFFNEPEMAIKLYDEAIKLDDVTGGGFREALASKQRLLKP
jgi:tetratricopeptide (TPR) repeat protein